MSSKKVLIVDDSIVVQKTLSMKLKSSGYQVILAPDGGTAVSAVRLEKPDLILLDIGFPPDVGHGGGVPWDGFLIMNWLGRLDEAKGIPIVIITGSDSEEYRQRALAAGAVGYFRKPINNDELLALVHEILSQPAPGSEAAPATEEAGGQ